MERQCVSTQKTSAWIGFVKAIVNFVFVMVVLGLGLTFGKDLVGAGSWIGVGMAVLFFCLVIEWVFRGWHSEQVEKIKEQTAKIGTAYQERVAGRIETIEAIHAKGKVSVIYDKVEGVVSDAGPKID